MTVLTDAAVHRPRFALWLAGLWSVFWIVLVAVPSVVDVPPLNGLRIDTDPENMLAEDEPVRAFHNEMMAEFGLYDFIVVGVVEETHPDGVFNARTLGDILVLARFAETIRWGEETAPEGVIAAELLAPHRVDVVEQAGMGAVRFDWLMAEAPVNDAEALTIRDRALNIPTLSDTLVSGDGRAMALYIPIREKNDSYRVASQLREQIGTFSGPAEYHITGLPIAQDQFGVEMFKQMAISAPAAMVLILILMWLFFRNLNLVLAPMVVAMVSVIGAMGLLVATGQTVHIMSSMIPIFVMPIAVLDAVHILSDFYDRYPQIKNRKETLKVVMSELWRPMLFTTLTTCAGFLSLALTPIPPVQVFGVFVAFGVFLAWLFTVTLIPAYIMCMPERAFNDFGSAAASSSDSSPANTSVLNRILQPLGRFVVRRSWRVVTIFVLAIGIAVVGLSRIEINDNPVKWFAEDHDIRVADRALNARFGGTYMAYLTLAPSGELTAASAHAEILGRLTELQTPEAETFAAQLASLQSEASTFGDYLDTVAALAEARSSNPDENWVAWDDIALAIAQVRSTADLFKRPDMLTYLEGLQEHLTNLGQVGNTIALPDIVKTIHRELFESDPAAYRIPDTQRAVAQTLLSFQNSHRPQDLFRLVTPDYRRANIWVQLTSGDNQDMTTVLRAVDQYLQENPPPVAMDHDWFGLTYINVIWQEKMVTGMAYALAGGFVAVLILMTALFRSFAWGVLSMIPLTVTIALIYGVIGLVGKDYDMPIAVLSSLSLGLAVDYAIHFAVRSRQIFNEVGDWTETARLAFGEPARAIVRNVIVIGAGFLPLLLAPLVPYQIVGVFISAILVSAGLASLLGLPALITLFQARLFKRTASRTDTGAPA